MTTFPGFEFYNGATITRVIDATPAEWVSLCAKKNGVFGFYVFRNGVHVPLTPFCSGRGSINGGGWWIAFDGAQFHKGQLPGFVQFPVGGSDNSAAVEALQRASQAQALTIAGIELALGNINQEPGMLDTKDREVLDRMRSFFGLD